jgi:hypothetical protein
MSNPTLFLRTDGCLLLARGEAAVECTLTPEQLLQLGVDCLRVATSLQPCLMDAAAEALEQTCVLPMENAQWPSTIN